MCDYFQVREKEFQEFFHHHLHQKEILYLQVQVLLVLRVLAQEYQFLDQMEKLVLGLVMGHHHRL
jgi:hypothetical protein